MSVFRLDWPVRFADTDPAGIVFYPRYFEMVNGVVESWFADEIGASFRKMALENRVATPTVHIEADFFRPSMIEDVLEFSLILLDLGRTSCTVSVSAVCEGEKRLVAKAVLVYANLDDYCAVPFPEEMRAAMVPFLLGSDDE